MKAARLLIDTGHGDIALEIAANVWRLWILSRDIAGGHLFPRLEQVKASYDHPTDAQLDHALNIDFVNERGGPSARVAVELSPESAKKLADTILTTLLRRDR